MTQNPGLPGSRRSRRSPLQSPYLHGALTALVLLIFAVWNGGAIPYPDTYEYLGRPANLLSKQLPSVFENDLWRGAAPSDRTLAISPSDSTAGDKSDSSARILAGRSPYWGLIAFLLYSVAGFWGIVIANALAIGTVLALAWSRGFGLRFGLFYYIPVLLMATLTAAGVFVAFLTPDILAATLIVALGLLCACWDRLTIFDRSILGVLATLATVSHLSHLAIAVVMLALGFGLRFALRKRVTRAQSVVVAMPVVLGAAATVLFGLAVKAQTGHPPMNLPFIAAHLSDIPAASGFLQNVCPEAGYELCNHLPQFGRGNWINFLFHTVDRGGVFDPSSQPVRDRLIAEQNEILFAAIRAKPVAIGGAFVLDGLRQIIAIDLLELGPYQHLPIFRAVYRNDVFDHISTTRIVQAPALFERFSAVQVVSTLGGGLAFIVVFAWRWRKDGGSSHRAGELVLLIMLGIVANAFICGILASPLGRFQARVMFLLIFVAFGILAARQSTTTSSR